MSLDRAQDLVARFRPSFTTRKTAVPIGLPLVDGPSGGFTPGRYIVVAGRTGQGKSTVALLCALNTAQQGIPTAYVSLEDPQSEVALRLASQMAGVSSLRLRSGKLTPAEVSRINNLDKKFDDLPFFAVDAVGSDLDTVCAAMDECASKGCKIIWIDYIQLIYSKGIFSDRRSQVNFILTRLKEKAILNNMVLCLVCQARRPSEGKEFFGPPRPYEMSESSAIEQGAQLILGVWVDPEVGIRVQPIKSSTMALQDIADFRNQGGVWISA